MKLSQALIPLIGLFALGCSGLTATLEPTPEDVVIITEKGIKTQDLPIKVLRVEEYQDGKQSRISIMASVSLAEIPDGADVKAAIARFRLKTAVVEKSVGGLALTWSPKIHIIQKALVIESMEPGSDEVEITSAQMTRAPKAMSLQTREDGKALRVGSGIDNLGPGDTGLSYGTLLAAWNPAANARVKESVLWLELDIARNVQRLLEEDTLIFWFDGPVTGSGDPEIKESYHMSEASPQYLRPYIHIEYVY
ncbi:MAG: hypothetical protein P1V97_18245 [Planctomycetota bacterium]|nr:hypothetical protein [Planctomycetota bacterium]